MVNREESSAYQAGSRMSPMSKPFRWLLSYMSSMTDVFYVFDDECLQCLRSFPHSSSVHVAREGNLSGAN